ncbi:hypothetical protein Mapa_009575 [Marchantia paleacea]|nr:hypothetical protein Mapa_009575 [Marchantia paleacea]
MRGSDFFLFIVLLGASEAGQSHQLEATTSSFSITNFSCFPGGNLICSGNATTTKTGELKLVPVPPAGLYNYTYFYSTMGVAMFHEPIQLVNRTNGQVASFSVIFSFRMEAGEFGPGDGLTLALFSDPHYMGTPGWGLGAFDSDGQEGAGVDVMVVEFDTYKNPVWDKNVGHVGIDMSNVFSLTSRETDFDMWRPARVYAWVDYNSSSTTLEVRISESARKPSQAFLTYDKDLLEVFNDEQVWVGFTGANGLCPCYSIYTISSIDWHSWFPSLRADLTPAAPRPDGPQNTTLDSLTTTKSSASSVKLIAGLTVGTACLVVGAAVVVCCFFARRKKKPGTSGRHGAGSVSGGYDGGAASEEFQIAGLSHSLTMFNYSELREATDDFSDARKLGEGGFGSVYRGQIPSTGQLVAVKKVSSDSKQGEREFIAEVCTISQLRHRNIVELLGWCCDGPSKYLLVYEFMPNGSLDNALFHRSREHFVLSWQERFKILGGIAAALQYLHDGWKQQVIHRDVKSSNVMLDDNFNAMLGDFGLARMTNHSENHVATAIAGTYGYIAPEASLTGKYTVKTDVFAFGVVALEIVCGRKVYDANFPAQEILLVDWVWMKLSEDDLFAVVDGRLEGDYDARQVEVVLLLGLSCSHAKAEERPAMCRVLEILSGSVEMPPISKTKPEAEYFSKLYRHRVENSPRSPHSNNGNGAFADVCSVVSSTTGSSSWKAPSGTKFTSNSGTTTSTTSFPCT